jgi:NAD(P)H-hydrate epimerase
MAILTRKQVREVDRRAIADYGMSGLVLMENAGRGVADWLFRLSAKATSEADGKPTFPSGPVAIVCGKGNNGGDGFVIARHLDTFGMRVRIVLLFNPNELSGDAAVNYSIIEKTGLAIETFSDPLDVAKFDAALAGSVWLVDAMLGTGATGEPKSPYAEAIDRMNDSGIPILSVDLPSGLDCDTGVASKNTIRASYTCTFVAGKPGLFVQSANEFVGTVLVVDIGVPRRLLEEIERAATK